MPFDCVSNHCPFHYGWHHFWCDPKYLKNLKVKEFIKGPFEKPKLVCSVPFVTRCQHYRTPVEFRKGIPDCWEEHLAQKLRFFLKHLRNNDLMYTENESAVPQFRKFRNYIGQGIPDPWVSFPYITEISSHQKDTGHRKHSTNKKERCLCCEREYLFECPDKCVANANCSCTDCHGKNLGDESIEKCRCSEIFHNWVLKNSGLNRRKQKRGNSGDRLSFQNGSNSETEDENRYLKERNKFVAFCECWRNRKGFECGVSENSDLDAGDHESIEKTCLFGKKNHGFFKHQAHVYFCPCIKNFYGRKFLERDNKKILEEPKKSVSKEIQAEIQPVKSSKIVQTEKREKKAQPKCTCHNKCFSCNVNCSCNSAWEKKGYPAVHAIPNFCCTSRFTQGPTFVCPYSLPNYFTTQQHCNETCEVKKQHKKKKHLRERESEEVELSSDQEKTTPDCSANKSKQKEGVEEQEQKEANYNLKFNQFSHNSQTPSTTAAHLKYLADYKLKGYLQQEEVSPGMSNKITYQNPSTGSKFINFLRGNSSLNNIRQEVLMETFKPFSYYKPRYYESSFAESKINLGQSTLFTSNSRFNYCDQATMTTEAENLESDPLIKERVSNGRDETEPCGCGNHEITRVLGKRRKLLRNRKRRKKLSSSVLGYQCLLADASKHTGTKGTAKDKFHTKEIINQNSTSTPGHLNFGESTSLRFADARYSFGRNACDISKKQLKKQELS